MPLWFFRIERSADRTIVTFATPVVLATILACLAAIVIGWYVRKRIWRLGWFLVTTGILVCLIATLASRDRALVDAEHFETGGAWLSESHSIRYAELTQLEVASATRVTRAGRRTDLTLVCRRRDGTVERVPVGDLMEPALGQLLSEARRHGVEVVAPEQRDEDDAGDPQSGARRDRTSQPAIAVG
jgi:hypothetical protein